MIASTDRRSSKNNDTVAFDECQGKLIININIIAPGQGAIVEKSS